MGNMPQEGKIVRARIQSLTVTKLQKMNSNKIAEYIEIAVKG